MTRKNANRTDPISTIMVRYSVRSDWALHVVQLEWNSHYFLRDTGRSSTGLLLLNSSTDPKVVFLDNGKFSVEINLAEPVEPFCKNRPNICFGWRSRSQPNDSRSTGRRKSDQIAEVSIQCYKNSVGFDGKPSYLAICFPGQARSSRIENVDSERGGRPPGPIGCLNFRRIIGALRIRRAQSLLL